MSPSADEDIRKKLTLPGKPNILHPLSSELLNLLDTDAPSISTPVSPSPPYLSSTHTASLNALIFRSEVIPHGGTVAVLRLSPTIVVKIDSGLDVSHIGALQHVLRYAPSLPIPRTHGVLRDPSSGCCYHFMDHIAGLTLESVWIQLSDAQKCSVQQQLDALFRLLRNVPPPPPGDGEMVAWGWEGRCKDTRRWERVSEFVIRDEAVFNDFLTTNGGRTRGAWIKMIRSFMRDDHACCMTHSDLHPRNIMVQLENHGYRILEDVDESEEDEHIAGATVKVASVIDWDKCGWYPEYWEFVKALHTLDPVEPLRDWCQFLPQSIGVWPVEFSLDLLISRWHG